MSINKKAGKPEVIKVPVVFKKTDRLDEFKRPLGSLDINRPLPNIGSVWVLHWSRKSTSTNHNIIQIVEGTTFGQHYLSGTFPKGSFIVVKDGHSFSSMAYEIRADFVAERTIDGKEHLKNLTTTTDDQRKKQILYWAKKPKKGSSIKCLQGIFSKKLQVTLPDEDDNQNLGDMVVSMQNYNEGADVMDVVPEKDDELIEIFSANDDDCHSEPADTTQHLPDTNPPNDIDWDNMEFHWACQQRALHAAQLAQLYSATSDDDLNNDLSEVLRKRLMTMAEEAGPSFCHYTFLTFDDAVEAINSILPNAYDQGRCTLCAIETNKNGDITYFSRGTDQLKHHIYYYHVLAHMYWACPEPGCHNPCSGELKRREHYRSRHSDITYPQLWMSEDYKQKLKVLRVKLNHMYKIDRNTDPIFERIRKVVVGQKPRLIKEAKEDAEPKINLGQFGQGGRKGGRNPKVKRGRPPTKKLDEHCDSTRPAKKQKAVIGNIPYKQ